MIIWEGKNQTGNQVRVVEKDGWLWPEKVEGHDATDAPRWIPIEGPEAAHIIAVAAYFARRDEA